MAVKRRGKDFLDLEALDALLDELEPEAEADTRSAFSFVPQPKQRELLAAAGVLGWYDGTGEVVDAKAPVIGYGGAAFGGKSYGMLGLAAICALAIPGVQIGYFRRTYGELEGAGSVSQDAATMFWGVAKKRDGGREWHFPSTGSLFQFLHCEHEADVNKYQSKAFDILLIDEGTHFTWEMIDYMLTRNRKSTNSRIRKPFCIICSNPGNIGHGWYMQMFDLEKMTEKIKKGHYNQVQHILNPNKKWQDVFFIPAFMEDNPIGMERDPEYVERLMERDPETAAALRHGLWDVFTGQMFSQFNEERHVIEPFEIPLTWPKWRAVDWGSAEPFCCQFFTKDIDKGRVFVYREIYAADLSDEQQAKMIVTYTPEEEYIAMTYADPAMWTKRNRHNEFFSSADEYFENGVPLTRADNDRLSGMRKVKGLLADLPDGKPGLQIFSTCRNLIRTLPKLSRSDTMPEDIAERQEDHAFDTLKYGLSNIRAFGSPGRKKTKSVNPWTEYNNL